MASVYLDTTILSFLHDRRQKFEFVIEATKTWWTQDRKSFEVFVSDAVIAELARGNFAGKEAAIRASAECGRLAFDPRIREIAEFYVEHSLMPRDLEGDALHLAYASFYKIDYILTWNFSNLANANKFLHIRILNSRLGISVPSIVTPPQLTGNT